MYEQIIARVEGTLKTLGIEPAEAKTSDGQYNISKQKDIELLIDVWEENNKVFFQVMSLLYSVTDTMEKDRFKMLLEENHTLVEASFALINNQIFIKEIIECSVFFNQERVLSSITRIAYYCEIYKAKWATEF